MSTYTGNVVGNVTGNVLGNIKGDLTDVTNITGNMVVVGNEIEGANVYGDCYLSNNMVVDGTFDMNGFMQGNVIGSVTGNTINLIGNLQLNGNTVGTLPFSGDIISTDPTKTIKYNKINTINNTDTLYLSNSLGKTNIAGELDCSGNVKLAGNMDVSGNVRIDGSLNVTSIVNNIDLSGNINVMGTTVLQDTLTVNNEIFINNGLTVVGDNDMLGSIFVAEKSTLNDDVLIGGGLDVTNDCNVSNNMTVGNDFDVIGVTNLKDTNIYGFLQPEIIKDYYDSSGNTGQFLSATGYHIKWKDLPTIIGGTNISVDNSNYNPSINLSISSDINMNNNNINNINSLFNSNGLTIYGSIITPNLATSITNDSIYIDGSGNLTKGDSQVNISDMRLKRNITDFSFNNSFEKIKSLQLKSYNWVDRKETQYGYIAQEVIDIVPEAVKQLTEDNNMLGIKTQYLNYLNIEATKELILENEKLKNIISVMNEKINNLEKLILKNN